jgi:hypothetical protein
MMRLRHSTASAHHRRAKTVEVSVMRTPVLMNPNAAR